MSLLSTMLAFVALPLLKRSDEDKEKIAELEREKQARVKDYEVLTERYNALQAQLNDERVRGELDRAQTRHWRSQSDYWQRAYSARAYSALAAPNHWGDSQLSQQRQQYHQGQQALQNPVGQQLSAQQQHALQQANYQQLGWLDCTCVPGRSEALLGERRDLYPRTPW
jgi:hypothetical protein